MTNLFSFLDPLFPSAIAAVALFALTSARFIGIMSIMPLFTRAGVDGLIRVGIALAFAAPLTVALTPQFVTDAVPPIWLMTLLMFKELCVGLALGVVYSVPIWAISTAGDIIDSYRNASAANTSDPVNAAEVSVFGTYLVILGLALFIAAGGLQVVIASTYHSFAVWPVQSFWPSLRPEAMPQLLSLLTEMGRIAFIVAAPLLVLMVVVDIVMLSFTRMNPQFQVFENSNSLKNLVLVVALPVYVSFFAEYMNVQWPRLFNDIDKLVKP
ncbi:MAG: EscT/YscT/HrcT family type III secretion system export apparatus protein [Bosea sp. (in: a-proteobacteria)]